MIRKKCLRCYQLEDTDKQSAAEDNHEEDDIPDDWKEVPEVLPIRRCLPVEDTSSEDNISERQQEGLMSVIEEVTEEEDHGKTASSSSSSEDEDTKIPDVHRGIGGMKPLESSRLSKQEPIESFVCSDDEPAKVEPLRKHHEPLDSLVNDERISPDTVTSNDSGMVDPHDEIYSPNNHCLNNGHAQEEDINVKNMSKLWEKDSKPQQARESLSKKWLSMPELKPKKVKKKKKDNKKEDKSSSSDEEEQQQPQQRTSATTITRRYALLCL